MRGAPRASTTVARPRNPQLRTAVGQSSRRVMLNQCVSSDASLEVRARDARKRCATGEPHPSVSSSSRDPSQRRVPMRSSTRHYLRLRKTLSQKQTQSLASRSIEKLDALRAQPVDQDILPRARRESVAFVSFESRGKGVSTLLDGRCLRARLHSADVCFICTCYT